MKKFFLFLILTIAFLALWFYPIYSHLSLYTDNCRKSLHLSKEMNDLQTLKAVLENKKQCQIALKENDKKFSDASWKSWPACKIYGQESLSIILLSPQKFKNIRESNAILDQLNFDAIILSSIRAKFYKNQTLSYSSLDEFDKLASKYVAYYELNHTAESVENNKAFLQRKYLNPSAYKSEKKKLPPFPRPKTP